MMRKVDFFGPPTRATEAGAPAAASLLYSIVLTTTILVIAGTMSASFVRANQRNHDMFRSTQAYYAARAAAEAGMAANSLDGSVGYEAANPTAISWDTTGDTVNDTTGEYEVFSRSKWLAWRDGSSPPTSGLCALPTSTAGCYVVPMPGTGGAGGGVSGGACDFTRPNDPTQLWDANLDDDCNWNKIEYEQTVTIPLYYDDPSCTPYGPNGICNPAELGDTLDTLILRVRTPNNEQLAGGSQVILNWEISGECDTDGDPATATETCYIVANPGPQSSYITGNSINAGAPHDVLTESDLGQTNQLTQGFNTIGIEDFLQSLYSSLGFEILTPVLKLSVIYPLTNSSNNDRIPYLEYQLLTERAIGDNKVISKGSARAQGRLGTYVANHLAVRDLGTNAIINFAVQN